MQSSKRNSTASDNIRVCARFRPFNQFDQTQASCVTYLSPESLQFVSPDTEHPSHTFTFSRLYPPELAQSKIYKDCGVPMIADILHGYNATLFVYGQTGSGKTHTMLGPPSSITSLADDVEGSSQTVFPTFQLTGRDAGIIPRMMYDLFTEIRKADPSTEFEMQVRFYEVYMERVRDLLNPTLTNLHVREDTENACFYVDGCTAPYVTSREEILEHLEFGLRHRATAATRMNDISSRSHCIFNLTVKSMQPQKGEIRTGKLFLVDLAGSEKVGKTKAEGVQLEEAKLINKSLTTLGLVINNLSNHSTHVPYRNSILTKILQDAIGGNSRTTLIICCSPSAYNGQETLSTLRFGQRAKDIQNRAVVNREYTVQELKHLLQRAHHEIEDLRRGGLGSGQSTADATAVEASVAAVRSEVTVQYQQRIDAESQKREVLQEALTSAEERLKEAQDALLLQTQQSNQKAALIANLQSEMAAWETEYGSLYRETRAQMQRMEISNQRADHEMISCLAKEIDGYRGALESANKELKEAIQEARRSAAEQESQYQHSVQKLQRAVEVAAAPQSLDEQRELPALRVEASQLRTLHDELQDKIKELQRTNEDLVNRNGSLLIDLQLADKKLAIRFERIENLKFGLKQGGVMNQDLQMTLDETRRECQALLDQAHEDSKYWRMRYETLHASMDEVQGHFRQGPRIRKPLRGGGEHSPASEGGGFDPSASPRDGERM